MSNFNLFTKECFKGTNMDMKNFFSLVGNNKHEYVVRPKKVVELPQWGIVVGVITIFASTFASAICATWILGYRFSDIEKDIAILSNDIKNMNSNINDINEDINETNNKLQELEELIDGDNGLRSRMVAVETIINILPIAASYETTSFVNEVDIKKNDISISTNSISSDTKIGIDTDGNVFLAEELINETILLTYIEDNKEIYFLGQYNENYHWDGYCVTNAYNLDGTLYGICESNFNDGNRLDYISLYYSDNNEWIYANREKINDENVGVTINYQIANKDTKNFTTTNVRIIDILYADNYLEDINKSIIQYYTGNTVDNRYNDSSGNAYEVKYDEDGTIRMLYVGKFEDGLFSDTSGNAFSIVYHDETDSYYCNTGNFENGRAMSPSNVPLTYDDINNIIEHYSFDCDLNWK